MVYKKRFNFPRGALQRATLFRIRIAKLTAEGGRPDQSWVDQSPIQMFWEGQ